MSGVVLCLLALAVERGMAYPYMDPRLQQDNEWREMMLWSQQPPPPPPPPLPPQRPQYEPSYGYPDYGDYGEPRPAFSEMDLLREQLALSEPPFNKRLPSSGYHENSIPGAWDLVPPPQGSYPETWYEQDVPLAANSAPRVDNVQELTEALMEALAQQIEQNRLTQALLPRVIPYEVSVDIDPVVDELKEASIKKSLSSSSFLTADNSDSSDSGAVVTTFAPTVKAAPSTVRTPASSQSSASGGQKEVPMLRPSNGRRHPSSSPFRSSSLDKAANTNASQKRQNLKKQMRYPRYGLASQTQSFVSNEDDLIQELDSLKKMKKQRK